MQRNEITILDWVEFSGIQAFIYFYLRMIWLLKLAFSLEGFLEGIMKFLRHFDDRNIFT